MTVWSPQNLLARMEAARRETSRHLDRVHRQIEERAERLTVTEKAKASNRTHNRSGARWTRADELLFQSHVGILTFMRRVEIEAYPQARTTGSRHLGYQIESRHRRSATDGVKRTFDCSYA